MNCRLNEINILSKEIKNDIPINMEKMSPTIETSRRNEK